MFNATSWTSWNTGFYCTSYSDLDGSSSKKLLEAPGSTTSNKKLLVAKGIATSSKKLLVTKGIAISSKKLHRY